MLLLWTVLIVLKHLAILIWLIFVHLAQDSKWLLFSLKTDYKILGDDLQCLIDVLLEPHAVTLYKMLHFFLFVFEVFPTAKFLYNSWNTLTLTNHLNVSDSKIDPWYKPGFNRPETNLGIRWWNMLQGQNLSPVFCLY